MNKVLFFMEIERQTLNEEINNELKIKNRLLKVLLENDSHKLSPLERTKLSNKYKDQIDLLESIRKLIPSVKNRNDIRRLNSMIEYYNSLLI